MEEQLGIEIFASFPDDSSMFNQENNRAGRHFLGGPRYTLRDNKLLCYITFSPKGHIILKILADILKWINDREIFQRNDNYPKPFLLLDNHRSWLEVLLLSSINNPQHKWVVCITCPSETSLW